MNNKENIKKNIRDGLDSLIPPAGNIKSSKKQKKDNIEEEDDNRVTHCNYLMHPKYLTNLKVIASKKRIAAKVALKEALDDYFRKNEKYL